MLLDHLDFFLQFRNLLTNNFIPSVGSSAIQVNIAASSQISDYSDGDVDSRCLHYGLSNEIDGVDNNLYGRSVEISSSSSSPNPLYQKNMSTTKYVLHHLVNIFLFNFFNVCYVS